MIDMIQIEINVNGRRHLLDVGSNTTLLDLLRDTLHLYGSKECCGVGECGACTVLVDGRTANSCLMLAVEADGAEITTIEGLDAGGLNALQRAFLEYGAVQSGFCVPGMLMAAQALLDQDATSERREISEALSGNLCRCGGYNRIVAAVRAVANAGGTGKRSGAKIRRQNLGFGRLLAELAPRRPDKTCRGRSGADVPRLGGIERVTGSQQFLADIPLPGMLYVKLVTLDAARAHIIGIDLTGAGKVPGVIAIVTVDGLPKPVPRFGPVYRDRPVLAVGETKYYGEPVAAVAATSKEAAELAVSLVRVKSETLPAVLSGDRGHGAG